MSFAPGHISLTFAIHDHVDPLKMGSTGLGIDAGTGTYVEFGKFRYSRY